MPSLLTKEEFLKGYNSYPPNAWIKFAFRYFSKNTKEKDKWVSNIAQWILMILFILGFISTAIDAPKLFIAIPTIIFSILLFSIGLLMVFGVIMNNFRIRKISKFLKITKKEYNLFASMYLEE